MSLFAGVHRGFSPPRPGAGVETKPELSVNYEAGSRIERRRFHAQLVGFFNDYSNLHGRDTFSSGGTGSGDLFNAGEVNSYGVETSFGVELLDRSHGGLGVPLALTYTWTVAEFQNSFSSSFDPWGNVVAGDRLPYIPEHQASASMALEFDHFRLGTLASYVSRTPTEALQGPIPDNRSVDARLIFDATAEVNFASYYAAFVSVQNITDEIYIVARRPAGVRPGLPRRMVAGVRLGF
ncbi:MAG: TonB-dependent receptor [Planctomycetes bacterium]|nr:TonB-dependent receptor [Planctomycetota bacterium]